MSDLQFFDSNIMIGPVKVPMKGQLSDTVDIIRRLEDCGIREGLIYHSSSVYNNPSYGNKRLMNEIRGIAGFHPVWSLLPFGTKELGDASELRKDLKQNSIKGVLLYPGNHGYINSEWCCGVLYELLESIRIPVFTRLCQETDFTWDQLHELLAAHPRLVVILRNAHYQIDRVAYRLLEKHDNLYIETCEYKVFFGIEEMVKRFGAHRLIFGSNAPLMSPGASTVPILLSNISLDEKRKIAGDNLRDLLGGIDYDA